MTINRVEMNVYLAEYIGTAFLILMGCGVNAGVSLNKSFAQNSGWLVICLGWGVALVFAIYAVGGISGAHFNPAVTVGLALAGEFSWMLVPGYIMAQLLGAMTGASLMWLHYLPHWKQGNEGATQLGIFCTSPAITSTFSNLFSEISGTFILVFALMFIGANEFAQGLNPIVIGLLIVSIGLSQGGTTGFAINPARDLGPRLAHFLLPIANKSHSNWKYAWIPVVGPMLGGMLGSLTYVALFKHEIGVGIYVTAFAVFIIAGLAIRDHNKR